MARVLVVDDDAAGLELRGMVLKRAGHEVALANTVELARVQFQAVQPEIVVLDLRLPEPEHGVGLIRDFRYAAPAVRIVVLSGYTPDLEGRPERAMADRILDKPLRTEVLLRALALQ